MKKRRESERERQFISGKRSHGVAAPLVGRAWAAALSAREWRGIRHTDNEPRHFEIAAQQLRVST